MPGHDHLETATLLKLGAGIIALLLGGAGGTGIVWRFHDMKVTQAETCVRVTHLEKDLESLETALDNAKTVLHRRVSENENDVKFLMNHHAEDTP